MTLPNVHSKAMSLQQAQQLKSLLDKKNPFCRIPPELAAKAEQAHKVLTGEARQVEFSQAEEALF